jgi:hypothetical protein
LFGLAKSEPNQFQPDAEAIGAAVKERLGLSLAIGKTLGGKAHSGEGEVTIQSLLGLSKTILLSRMRASVSLRRGLSLT